MILKRHWTHCKRQVGHVIIHTQRERERHSLYALLPVEVGEHPDVDREQRDDDAEEGDWGEAAHEPHPQEHHRPHQGQQDRAVRAEVVGHDGRVAAEVPVQGQAGGHVVLEQKKNTAIGTQNGCDTGKEEAKFRGKSPPPPDLSTSPWFIQTLKKKN